ncbi:hypothetical protein R6Q59_032196 [Mikania micrantha]
MARGRRAVARGRLMVMTMDGDDDGSECFGGGDRGCGGAAVVDGVAAEELAVGWGVTRKARVHSGSFDFDFDFLCSTFQGSLRSKVRSKCRGLECWTSKKGGYFSDGSSTNQIWTCDKTSGDMECTDILRL